MVVAETPNRAILGGVVGGITGLVAGGSLGIFCSWSLYACVPISGIASAILGALFGRRLAPALYPIGDRAVCQFAADVLGGVGSGTASAILVSIVLNFGFIVLLYAFLFLWFAVFWFWWITVPVVVVVSLIVFAHCTESETREPRVW